MDAVLLIEDLRDGRREARLLPQGRAVLVGRSTEADLRLPHPSVSPIHLRLTFDGHALWAEDLETQTGSWLGHRLLSPGKPEAMREGEPLQLGEPFRLLLTTAPSDRQHGRPLDGPQPGTGFDERFQMSARALEALDKRAGDVPHPALAAPPFPALLAHPHPALGAPHPAFVAPHPALGAPPEMGAPAALDFAGPHDGFASAPPQVFEPPMLSARGTMALEPTVLAAMQALGKAPRPSGHTAIINAARPEPGAGSMTFSGIVSEGRELIAPQVLAAASRGSPLEQGGARSSGGRERASGGAQQGRQQGSRPQADRSSGARRSASGRMPLASAPRRKVVRQRGSIWPFFFLGVVILALGGVATSLFMHGELPWKNGFVWQNLLPWTQKPAAAVSGENAGDDDRAAPTNAATNAPEGKPAKSASPTPSVASDTTANSAKAETPAKGSAATTHGKQGKNKRRQSSSGRRERAQPSSGASAPGAV